MLLSLPEKIDAERLASQRTTLNGVYLPSVLHRLAKVFLGVEAFTVSVLFSPKEGGGVILSGNLKGAVTAVCQRCLNPVRLEIDEEFEHLPEDADSLLEVGPTLVPADSAMNLLALIEDEVLLASPMIPRHTEACYDTQDSADEGENPSRENPFDVLASLRQNTTDKRSGTDPASNPEE